MTAATAGSVGISGACSTELAERTDVGIIVLTSESVDLPSGVTSAKIRRRAPGRIAHLEHELLLPREILRHRTDVFCSPTADPPQRRSRPIVATVHDVIPLVLDDPSYRAHQRRWKRRAARIRSADAVIAVSEYTARESIRMLGLEPARVHVALHGVAPVFAGGMPAAPSVPPYVLLVGEYGPNKGYPEAFAMIAALAERGQPHQLKVAGRIAPWVRPQLETLVARSPRPDRVELLGYVPDDELATLYRGATALVVTSRAEGFCLPAAEAMASGTPVVAFRNSALEEVVANGGTLVDDGDVTAMTRELLGLIESGVRWEHESGRARSRAAAFDWARCAAVHAEVFHLVAE